MTRVVIDASAASALIIQEETTAVTRQLWGDPSMQFHAPAVLLVEVASAVLAAKAGGRVIDSTDEDELLAGIERVVERRLVDDDLVGAAAGLLRLTGPCRGMDLLYLAVAVELGGLPLLSFDRRQRGAAATLGLPLLPAEV